MGWVALALIGLGGAGLLAAFGLKRPLWSFAGAGLMLAVAAGIYFLGGNRWFDAYLAGLAELF